MAGAAWRMFLACLLSACVALCHAYLCLHYLPSHSSSRYSRASQLAGCALPSACLTFLYPRQQLLICNFGHCRGRRSAALWPASWLPPPPDILSCFSAFSAFPPSHVFMWRPFLGSYYVPPPYQHAGRSCYCHLLPPCTRCGQRRRHDWAQHTDSVNTALNGTGSDAPVTARTAARAPLLAAATASHTYRINKRLYRHRKRDSCCLHCDPRADDIPCCVYSDALPDSAATARAATLPHRLHTGSLPSGGRTRDANAKQLF